MKTNNTQTQTQRLANVLFRNAKGRGITVHRLCKLAKVPRTSVYRRIHELRDAGLDITSQVFPVKGKKTHYYLLSAAA
jgi:predicted DNA-binding transcriptional regulator YafY